MADVSFGRRLCFCVLAQILCDVALRNEVQRMAEVGRRGEEVPGVLEVEGGVVQIGAGLGSGLVLARDVTRGAVVAVDDGVLFSGAVVVDGRKLRLHAVLVSKYRQQNQET